MTDSPDKARNCLLDNKPTNKEDVGCPWHINSPEHHNCLWVYIKDKSGPDGSMPELVQSEIAQLLGWSNTKTHFMLKQAMAELVEALQKYRANQLISAGSDPHVEINTIGMDPVTNYSEDSEE